MTNTEKVKVFCAICGDVSQGHPEADRLRYEILVHGFKMELSSPEPRA